MITIAAGVLALLLHLITAGLALRALRETGRRGAWMSVPLAAGAALLAAHQGVALSQAGHPAAAGPAGSLTALATAVLLLLGVARIAPQFRACHEAERSHRRDAERYRELLDSLEIAVWETSPDGSTLLYANPATERIYGRPAAAFHENPSLWDEVVVSEDRELADHAACAVHEAGRSEGDYRVRRPDGEVRWVHDRRQLVHDEADQPLRITGIATDITDWKRAERALQTELDDNKRLQELSTRLIPTDDIEKLYQDLVAAAVEIMRADRGTMQLLDDQTGELCMLAAQQMPRELREDGARLSPDWAGTSCTEAMQRCERVIVEDLETDEWFGGTYVTRRLLEAGIRAAQSTPLITRSGRMVGMLTTHWDQQHQPDERQLRLMDILARQAADLIERRQAEDALRDSERRFRAVFDQAAVGVALLSPQGRLTHVNRRLCDIVGYGEGELLAMDQPVRTLTHPEDMPTEEPRLTELLRGERSAYQIEKRYIRKDGQAVWGNLTASVLTDASGRIEQRIGVVEDITDRKEAEQALRDSERRFRRAVVDSPVPVMIHAEDGEILHVSGAWARLSGYDHEQIPDLAEWTRRAYGPEADFHYRLIMDKHKNQSELEAEREVTVRTRDGGHRHWLMTSAPLGRLPDGRGLRQSVAVDITERIQAEQALRDSEQRFRALAENSVVGLWQITPEGRTLYVNPAMARLLEVDSSDELRGEPADAFYTEGSAARIHEQLRKRQKGETTVYEAELVGRRGTHRHMLIHGAPIFDAEGYLQSNFGTFVDITERKEAERRQKLLTDELDHRVKNNLASVMGLATRTLDASRSLSQFREAFLGRLRAMTRTHDALARARWEGVDLTDVARLVAGAFADEQHQRLSLEGPRILLPARLALPLSLAMHELAANAVHHGALSRPEGQVELAWSIDERENRIRLRWQETGGPRARKPRRPGVGLQLIEGLITYEAGGRLNMAFEPTGLRCEMDLPTPET